ncbi:MAG: hypothetical protein J5842_06595 [Lachnospiraceae bacterium]|nr:hypothetical protein [Lachnospiraceae bacterium]
MEENTNNENIIAEESSSNDVSKEMTQGIGSDENGELLRELIELQKKTARRQLIAMTASVVMAAAFIIALIVVLPMMVRMSKEVSAMVANTEALIEQANELIGQAGESLDGIDTMIQNVNKVVTDNTEAATEAISNIQNIDIDQLNEAIRNLSDAVEPLAKLNNSISNGMSGIFSKIGN